ncbi:putative monovalent cation/H+ antiporter subunit A [Tianweitania sediminis]|uniref:Putative monovalent cation/H+ antiporter subunit A n=1 Tax=Tianweitania sediminis TaxID=1502156 RepID=A0A8J7UJJ1_9HYPH|nr:putative monovalent cation/H+ antiporter subunit A [Tianweitania sediminis]MBP0438870.1 putative monovalent cation/H+ antiporter subunit A [Tianweitania sediminis]
MQSGSETALLIGLALPFAGAAVAPWLMRRMGDRGAWLLALIPLFAFTVFVSLVSTVASGTSVRGEVSWIPSLGVTLAWYLDGLSTAFALLISGIGTLIVLYSGGYLHGHPQHGRFMSYLLLFMGAMQGLVVADNFMMLFVFWELTSIASFLLIGFDHEREASRRAALQALVVTGLGGLALLAGLVVIGMATTTDTLSGLLAQPEGLRGSELYLPALLLILLAAFTKSAQLPFHFWLPNAMQAPTPVSAYLHSATMVKAGVYLLMRLNPAMGETAIWETVLPLFGGATLLVGSVLALRQTDLKLMLAYTTVGSLGLLVMLTGFGSDLAVSAAVLYLIAHALFKGALFMVVGILDHETGSRDTRDLGGLRKAMPITFAAAIGAALSMAGIPLFTGFLAKEAIYEALTHDSGGWPLLILLVAILGNATMVAIGFAVGLRPFIGRQRETPKHPHEGPALLWLGPVVLAITGLLAALLYGLFYRTIADPMTTAVAGSAFANAISPLPHVSLAFGLSLVTLAVGLVLYAAQARLRGGLASVFGAGNWGPDRGFDHVVAGLVRLSAAVLRIVQNGRLDVYITIAFITTAVVLLVPMVIYSELPSMPPFPALQLHEWTLVVVALVGLYSVVRTRNRLTAIVSLGIQGFAVAVLFVLMGAPDLSFTQFMVETLSVIVLALTMTRLHLSPTDHRPWNERLFDGSIAIACGVAFTLLLLRVTQNPFDASLSEFFNANARIIAHGRNVVNVIIVDFRALDTLGEIAVVAVTGLVILALLRIATPGRIRGRS